MGVERTLGGAVHVHVAGGGDRGASSSMASPVRLLPLLLVAIVIVPLLLPIWPFVLRRFGVYLCIHVWPYAFATSHKKLLMRERHKHMLMGEKPFDIHKII